MGEPPLSEPSLHIPLTRPSLSKAEIDAVAEVLASGWLTQGPVVERFEKAIVERVSRIIEAGGRSGRWSARTSARELGAGASDSAQRERCDRPSLGSARRLGSRGVWATKRSDELQEVEMHGVALCNATAALHLSLLSLGVGPGDEVIVPSLTFIATANVVRHVGATPVFVDTAPGSFNVDAAAIGRVMGPRTRAVIVVHQFGDPVDLDLIHAVIKSRGAAMIEDAACALGSVYHDRPIGGGSDLACFSFHPRKVITTGEGGMIVTRSADTAALLRRLRHHGMEGSDWNRHRSAGAARERYTEAGYNYRLSDVAAAIGLAQLGKLDWIVSKRRSLARTYDRAFGGLAEIATPVRTPGVRWNAQSYGLFLLDGGSTRRDALVEGLRRRGIQAKHGLACIHQEPCYAEEFHGLRLPESERASETSFLLPLFPEMTAAQQQTVIEAVTCELARGLRATGGRGAILSSSPVAEDSCETDFAACVTDEKICESPHTANRGRGDLVSIVIPMFNESGSMPELRRRVEAVRGMMSLRSEVILVDDASTDDTGRLAQEWSGAERDVRVLQLSRNFGSHAALTAGLHEASGNCAVFFAADLQDPPELICKMVERWQGGDEIVWATRAQAHHVGGIDRMASRLYWWLMRRGAPDATPPSAADFALLDRRVLDAFRSMKTRNESIIAALCWMGFRQGCVDYHKEPRLQGRSGWSFAKRWKLLIDSVVGYSYWPIRAMSALGMGFAAFGFLLTMYLVWHRMAGHTTVPGWAGLMSALLSGLGVLMLMIGVLGEYVWRVLDEIRGRPKYIVVERSPASQPQALRLAVRSVDRGFVGSPGASSLTEAQGGHGNTVAGAEAPWEVR